MSLQKYLYTPTIEPSTQIPIELDKYQKNAIQLVQAGYNLFITGSAGSGKSFLIRKCIQECSYKYQDRSIAVTSTTGISSLNIHGITIHSWAGITPHTDFNDVEGFVDSIRNNYKKYNHWKYTKLLIIDEISMLSVVIFNFLHKVAMNIRRNSLPFGGIQLIIVGDFFQLPPVRDTKETDFCFKSVYWNSIIDYSIVLKKTHRQKETELISFLKKIRLGITDKSVQESLALYQNNPNYNSNYTHLYPNKFNVKAHNLTKVFALEGDIIKHQARMIKKNSYNYEFPTHSTIEETLLLKRNAFIIINKNIDVTKGLVNGRQGIFLGFSNKYAKIKTEDGHIHNIDKARWEFPNYSIEQYPLRLAWALTIHKSQGMGIEKLSVDIGKHIFDDGQVYVALSRATNANYLHIKNYSLSSIRVNKQVKRFYRQLKRSSLEWYQHTDEDNRVYYQNKVNGCIKKNIPTNGIIVEEVQTDQTTQEESEEETLVADANSVCSVCHIHPYEQSYKLYYNEKVCFNCSIEDEYYMELNKDSLRKQLYISKKDISNIVSNCRCRAQSNKIKDRKKRFTSSTKLYLLGHVKECLQYS